MISRAFTTSLYLSAALLLSAQVAGAAETIKIGVLNDQSGVFADNGGVGSVAAAKLAAEDFGGEACSATSFHFNYDTYALSKLTSEAITKAGGNTWYFISADYAFGHALQRDATKFIEGAGGKVIGSSAHPLGTTDMASFLLQ